MAQAYCKLVNNLNFIVLILIFVCTVYCDNVIPRNQLDSQMFLLLKEWRISHLNSTGVGVKQLPSLKSIQIPDFEYSYDEKGIKMTFNVNKMELIGLDNFIIKELLALESNKGVKMIISINIPKLILQAENYELKGRAFFFYPLKGSGNMSVVFRDIDLNFKISFTTIANGVSSRIGDFRFDYNVHEIDANLTDSSWPLNEVLSTEGVKILASHHDDIVQAMWDYIVPYVNERLVNVTTAQIVHAFMSADGYRK